MIVLIIITKNKFKIYLTLNVKGCEVRMLLYKAGRVMREYARSGRHEEREREQA